MPFFEKDDFWGVASNRVRRTYKLFDPILDDILGEGGRADDACGGDLWLRHRRRRMARPRWAGGQLLFSLGQRCGGLGPRGGGRRTTRFR